MNYRVIEGHSGIALTSDIQRQALLDSIGPMDIVCEVGTHHGSTCRYLAERRSEARFICIDNLASNPIIQWLANKQQNMNLFVGTLQEFALVASTLFNMIFVDACHKEDPCYNDLETARLLVLPHGTIVAHDYGFEGVTAAVDRYCLKYRASIVRKVECLAFIQVTP